MQFYEQVKNQKGASAVELAIVLPLLVTLTFGIIEFGILLYNKALITNASREGARFGILFETTTVHDDTAITNKVNEHLKNGNLLINLGGSSSTPTISISPSSRSTGTLLSVSVAYPYDFLFIPNFIPVIPNTLTLNSETTMRME